MRHHQLTQLLVLLRHGDRMFPCGVHLCVGSAAHANPHSVDTKPPVVIGNVSEEPAAAFLQQTVVAGRGSDPGRRPLKHSQFAGNLRDLLDRLESARACSNDTDALARQIYRVIPARRVPGMPCKIIDALDSRVVWTVELTNGAYQSLRAKLLEAAVRLPQREVPTAITLVIFSRHHFSVVAYVLLQAEFFSAAL